MNMYCWHKVNKHRGSAFIANSFLTRNSLALSSQEPNVQPSFYRISFVNECKHMRNCLMLVL